MPLFYDETCDGLGQEPSGLSAQLPNAWTVDPAQLACVDPQILGADFVFGPFHDNNLFNPSDASVADDPILSASPSFTSEHSDASNLTTNKAIPEHGVKPKKRGRKPRIKTKEEKERQLQRQRQRNRLAATRCRSKKKGETQELEQNAERLRERRDSLRSTLDGLSSEVLDLKEAVIKHRHCGSGEVEAYIQHQFHQLVEASLESSSTSQNTTPEMVSDDLVLSPLDSPRLSTGIP